MGTIQQRDFSGGWNPSADQTNGPDNVLYRMDNCVLDELGAVSLRAGSSKVNSSALATTDVRSIYSAWVSGVRYRLAQGAGSLYAAAGSAAFASIASGFDSALDVQFSSYLGEIIAASGTVKKKYDGTTVRTWGIPAATTAPTIAIVAPSNKVIASCDSGETTWADNESASFSNVAGFDGAANGARSVVASATTFRGVQSRDIGSSTNLTDYGSSIVGTDDDVIELYVKVDDPDKADYITMTIDLNGTAAATFDKDYFIYTWLLNQNIEAQNSILDQLASDYSIEGYARLSVADRAEERPGFGVSFKPEANGWNYLSVPRRQFLRIKTTDNTGWDTVRGVRVAFGGRGQATVAFDRIRIIGGDTKPATGRYKWRYCYVREATAYTGKSAPSTASAETELKNEGATVTCTNPTDTQVTHIWLFRMGGTLDRFYRTARFAVTNYTGTAAITDNLSDKDALISNIPMETDNLAPPDNIVGISEDYYTRIFALSSDGNLYPSRLRNIDSFSSGQVIRVFGATETGYWVKKSFGGLYVGTSKDIYRVSGTGAENADGTVDFQVHPLNINSPPINNALGWDGNILIYMASDGPRLFNGETSSPLREETDLLWRGYTRYGVSPVNLTTGRHKMAISKGLLALLQHEGTSTTTTAVIWKYNLAQQKWYRHTYGSQQWRSLFREQDGTLIAGDNAGFVWVLEDAAASGDAGTGIPVELRTKHYTLPSGKAEPTVLRVRLDTGNTSTGLSVHLDGNEDQAANVNPQLSGEGIQEFNLSSLASFRQIGFRLTGTVKVFRFYDIFLAYVEMPDARKFWQIGPVDFGDKVVWLREVRLKTLGRPGDTLTVIPYFDGAAKTTSTVSMTPGATVLSVPMGREISGKQLSALTIASGGSEFSLWWVEFLYRLSGGETQKKLVKVAA